MGAIHPKVAGFTVSGSIVVILVWTLGLISARLQVPDYVAAAMTTLIGTVIAYYIPSVDRQPPPTS